MRQLREDERDEIESVAHFVRYAISKPNIETYELYNAMMKLNDIAKKYVISGIVTDEELSELTQLEDSKELVNKFMMRLCKEVNFDMEND